MAVEADTVSSSRWRRLRPGRRVVLAGGLVVLFALMSLCGWGGQQMHRQLQERDRDALFLQAARQGAVNLTTISHTEADADVQRIMDSATGEFYDDFQKRSKPFVEVVKKAQSVSVGSVTEAGIESIDGDGAQALVAVSVKTSNAGATDQQPRLWRMRIFVQKVGQDVKVSKVQFVP